MSRPNKNNVGRSRNEESALDQLDDICSLSIKARVTGFILCLLLGTVVIGLGYFAVTLMRVRAFVVLYCIGNALMLSSTGFIVGPLRQLTMMFAPSRLFATVVYILCTIITFLFAYSRRLPLAIVFLIFQFFSLLWYGLSYIPYARDLVLKFVGLE